MTLRNSGAQSIWTGGSDPLRLLLATSFVASTAKPIDTSSHVGAAASRARVKGSPPLTDLFRVHGRREEISVSSVSSVNSVYDSVRWIGDGIFEGRNVVLVFVDVEEVGAIISSMTGEAVLGSLRM